MSAKPASEQLRIRLHGFPIAYSASPLFQNTCFETDSYAWRYELYSTSKLTRDVLDFLRSEDSAGAAWVPLARREAVVDRRLWVVRTGEGVKLMKQLHHAAQSRDHALPG